MTKFHFWVTLLDHAVSRTIKPGYFERLCNSDTLFETKYDRYIIGMLANLH